MAKVKLRSAETVEEVDWLLGGGMSPHQICESMQASPGSIAKAGWRVGRKDIYSMFSVFENEFYRKVRRESRA